MASGQRVRLGRIIIDAPPDKAVGFAGRGAFRDYRRSNLKLRKPIKSMKDPELGREEAIKLARALYEVNPIAGLTYLTGDAYEVMLRDVFAAADASSALEA
jgi:hypothetical protein